MLGLFPSFGGIGGIEASGRLAWEPFASQPNTQLFTFGKDEPRANRQSERCVFHAASKAEAVLTALRRHWPAGIALFWHVGLLKLLPFLRLRDAKVVLFLHGIEVWREQDRLTQRLLRRVDLFLSNSEHTWRRFVSFNPGFEKAAHRIVHLGVGQACGNPVRRPDDRPAILMIGRMLIGERYKGHKEMLAVWARVLAKHAHAQLWIVGPGPLRNELERTVRQQGLAHSVHIYGQVSEEEKEELLVRCRGLALPSRGEGFGIVYLEAMRMGRPCLVSTVDAGREVVNPPEAGLAVDPNNLDQVAEGTLRLLSAGSEWERWSAQARVRYESQFTAAHFHQRLLAAIQA